MASKIETYPVLAHFPGGFLLSLTLVLFSLSSPILHVCEKLSTLVELFCNENRQGFLNFQE